MRKIFLGAMGLGMFLGVAPMAFGHPTGHESRTPAECERLPTPERQACLKCVTRPAKHHYHPDYPAGARCRPDNGKP
jgi:hypothetical protein